MSCEPKFDATVPVDCVRELVADIRNELYKVQPLATLNKALWVGGCLTALTGGQPTILAANQTVCPLSSLGEANDKLSETTEAYAAKHDTFKTEILTAEGLSLDPVMIATILQAINYIINFFTNLRR